MKAGKKKTEEKTARILEKLDELYGTEKEGFYHNQDWQLLVAIMLSAQSTDKQVDEALPALFERFQTAQEVAEAPVEEIERYIRSVGLYKNTHVFRISRRLGWAEGKNPVEVEQELMKVLPEDHWNRINFQLIYLGRTVCTARKAHCEDCPLQEWCDKKIE